MLIKAELIHHMGDDLTVVNAARVSFDKESEYETNYTSDQGDYSLLLSSKDQKLINYLAKHGHFTPFTHPQITLRETVPIAMARQRFKHTVGFAYNETSRRYVSDQPEYFIPAFFRSKPEEKIKQGSGGVHKYSAAWVKEYEITINAIDEIYQGMILDGVAPEEARLILPQAMFTSYYVTGSLAAWARAYNLRNTEHAQKMFWPDMVQQWDKIIQPLFPVSWAALKEEKETYGN